MKQKLAIILFISMVSWIFYVIVANAIPPSPPSSGSDVAITGGNVTGITNLSATTANVTGTSTANVLNVTTANITQIKTTVAADNTLSGTPIIITVYDVATNTPYYFKAYPTKP